MDPDWAKPYRQRQKDLEPIVDKSITATLERVKNRSPTVSKCLHLGAIGIAPESLAVWFIFKTDAEKASASSTGLLADLEKMLKEALALNGYPEDVARRIRVLFASEEEIEREGGWMQFFL